MKLCKLKAVLAPKQKRTSSNSLKGEIEECTLLFLSGDELSRRTQFELLKDSLYRLLSKDQLLLILPRHKSNGLFNYERIVARVRSSNDKQVEAYLTICEKLEKICIKLDIPYLTTPL